MPNLIAASRLLRCGKRKSKKKTKRTKKRVGRSCHPSPHLSAEPSEPDKPIFENPAESSEEEEEEEAEDDELDCEPYGFKLKSSASSRNHIIQPLGNLLLRDPSSNARDPGLGDLRVLTDEIVLEVLAFLGAEELGILASVSKSFYVFSHHEPLWRNLVLDELKGGFLYNGTWSSTYIFAKWPALFSSATTSGSVLRIRNFYSDYLFQSWLCASLEMKPEWLERDNIQRRRNMTVDEFISCFEEPNKPVLLENCVESWPAMKKWNRDKLIRLCGDAKFAVGPVEMKLNDYFLYADNAREERPLYLFDSKFADKVPQLGSDYNVPVYFREDLFSVLGEERPDYRWIIIGPAGSGSSFHVDPNSTSAWNAVVTGSKKWVMFPPDVVPPGVHPSPDGADVACPVSIIEWFMNFYGACKDWKKRPIECISKAGDVVFVPNGWWHLVINLEDSIAITQNYVSRRNLLDVLDFLKRPNASELVSGTHDRVNLFDKFDKAIQFSFPGLVGELRQKAEAKIAQQKKPTFWESVTDARVGGFKFSF